MKISPCMTHPQGILGVFQELNDFLLSDESNQSYIKNCSCSSKLKNGIRRVFYSTVQKKSNKAHPSIIKRASHGSGGWILASCSDAFLKEKYPYLKCYKHFCLASANCRMRKLFQADEVGRMRRTRTGDSWQTRRRDSKTKRLSRIRSTKWGFVKKNVRGFRYKLRGDWFSFA